MSLIVAFDPGVTTGVAWYRTDSETFHSCELSEHEVYELVDGLCEAIDHVQIEKFVITQATTKKVVVYDSLYLIGYLRYAAWRCGFTSDMTKPADVMAPFADSALKRVGWHKPGMGHANDAARHLAHHLVKTRQMSGGAFLQK